MDEIWIYEVLMMDEFYIYLFIFGVVLELFVVRGGLFVDGLCILNFIKGYMK